MTVRISGWLDRHEPSERASLSQRNAVALTLVLYLGAFGPGVWQAIELYRGRDGREATIGLTGTLVSGICEALIAVIAALAIIRCLVGTWRPVLGPATWRRELVAGSLFVTMAAGSAWLMPLFPHRTFPAASTGAGQLADAIGFLRAGPLEETCALLAPLLILRAGRVPWAGVFAILVGIRMSYHLYYGGGAVVVMLWASGAVFVYLWARSIIGLAVAHSIYDLTGLPAEQGHPAIAALLHLVLVLFCLVVSLRFGWRVARRRRDGRAGQLPSTQPGLGRPPARRSAP